MTKTAARVSPPPSSLPQRIQRVLRPIWTRQFLKFCGVGATGVIVNLGFLWLFADHLNFHDNVASALAIEVSIVSNFILNELWTFRAANTGNVWARGMRFHVVSLAGAFVQLTVFVAFNFVWFWSLNDPSVVSQYFSSSEAGVPPFLRPILSPPEVGGLKYASQAAGIGVSVIWNFLANFHWTWKLR